MIGSRLAGRYELTGELGRGGMGMVYLARDPLLNREVAIKLLPSTLLTPEAEERFQREAQVVAQIDHPAIVPIFDIGRHVDRPGDPQSASLFFVMPVVKGRSLRAFQKERSLRMGDVLAIGEAVADALDYAHQRGIVHRDIKPENVMVSRDDGAELRVRVMDFGLAVRSTEDRLTKSGSLVGTIAYLSPEQVASRELDGRSDVYSLAVVLYECLCGEPPFTGDIQSVLYRIVHEKPRSPRAIDSSLDGEVADIVLQCLAKNPNRRPARASSLSDALRRCRQRLDEAEKAKAVGASSVWTLELARPVPGAFVGREVEFGELQDRLNLALEGECHVGIVSGEPGVGKSRLLSELETLAKARRIRVLKGRFAELDRAFPYQGLCEPIQEFFQAKGESGAGAPDITDLAQDLVALFPALAEVHEIRAALAGSSLTLGAKSPGLLDRNAVFELLARTLTRLSGGKPLVLILENLHRAEVSLEALQYIARRLGPTPTLIVGSFRSNEVDRRHPVSRFLAGFEDDPRFVHVVLRAFTPEEQKAFLETLLSPGTVTDALAKKFHDATEGNPFFTKELVRSLVDSGGLVKGVSGHYTLSGVALSPSALPATIQQAVEARVARLPEAAQETLAAASVLGRSFDIKSLAAVCEKGTDAEEDVDVLLEQGLLEEERGGRGNRLAFPSAIVRDVLYAGLPRRRRKALHRRYAELLEKRHAGNPSRAATELFFHYSQADMPEKSVEYGLAAARAALDAFSPEDAARSARTVLDFVAGESWEGGRPVEAETRLLLARAQRMEGQTDSALREAERALKVFDEMGAAEKAAITSLFLAETAWAARRTEEARRHAELGLEKARRAGSEDVRGRLLSLAATVANLSGHYANAKTFLEEAERLSAGPAEHRADAIPTGGTLVVGLGSPLRAAEPADVELVEEEEVLGNVFETLAAVDADGNLVPHLAERWEVRQGGRELLLVLRDGVRFHDGSLLTAHDVKAAFERSLARSGADCAPALTRIEGARQVTPAAPQLPGVEVVSDRELRLHLTEPLPLLPALLTDIRTAITRENLKKSGPPVLMGTGPFRLESFRTGRVMLERYASYWGRPARLSAVEFKPSLGHAALALGLRSGELDVARDLLPEDLDEILRQPRLRNGVVEAPKRSTYFALFNLSRRESPVTDPRVRRALRGVVRPHELVPRTCGRFAQAATGILPPGMLGHDPGRRGTPVTRERALELLKEAGAPRPLTLQAAVHPVYLNRFRAVLKALIELWGEIGVELELATTSMPAFLASIRDPSAIDVSIGRWIADYDDPDSFCHGLFHGEEGRFRRYYTSAEADALLGSARAETRPEAREALYRKLEDMLLGADVLLPLLHDIDYRVAGPRVRGLTLRSTPPFVAYAEVGKEERLVTFADGRRDGGGLVHVPVTAQLQSLDPALISTVEQGEVLPNVFESLTRVVEGARVVPWLASSIEPEDGGTRFRVRLNEGIRFHDGRRLTARDVRYTFERLLQDQRSDARWRLAPLRGARRLADGVVSNLEGISIESATELVLTLETRVPFFPALLADSATAIVPEGSDEFTGGWRDRCVGTGPFRITRFVPGNLLELERNPIYWREGFPKADALAFHLGVTPEVILEGFKSGRFSIASDLYPADVEELRRDPVFAAGYHEIPFLSTYFFAFNIHRPPLHDVALRRRLADTVDTDALVNATLGRLGIPAQGLIPPGLLGAERRAWSSSQGGMPSVSGVHRGHRGSAPPSDVDLSAVVNPIFLSQYAALARELYAAFKEKGVRVHPVNRTLTDFHELRSKGEVDLYVGRGVADYPDPDTFAHGILHTKEGLLGRFCGTPELDSIIERARTELDPDVRHSLYRELEATLANEALLIPLFHEQVYRFARPELEGLQITFSTPPVVAYENLWVRRQPAG